MKQLFTLFISLILFYGIKAQDFDNQGVYMDYIGNQQEKVTKKYLSYVSASAHGKKAKKVESLRAKLLDEVQECRMNIGAMPSFKGDKSYRDSAEKFMKFYFSVLNDDYSKIINMEEIAEQSYDNMEAYLMAQEMVQKKMKEANAMMDNAQKDFAAKNNVNLIANKSELGEMMDKVGKVNEYYHKLYLLFFKANAQEDNLMEALEKQNITGIEQARSALKNYAEDGLKKLIDIPAFEGDNSLINACKNALNFYAAEGGEKMKSMSDYYLVKERFETLKKAYEIKGSNRTKEDVDNYNKGVNEINTASDNYNKQNNELNQSRGNVITNWNNSINEFFDTHTPRYK